MNLDKIAQDIKKTKENIVLIYAFNATGKTRLSVAYKDITKKANGNNHAGVYYNAFSEDLFVWDNDENNDGKKIQLMILESSLNEHHSLLTEDSVLEKLTPYKPKYRFFFNNNKDVEKGIDSVSFYLEGDKDQTPIKISRGEERIFVWCFFLAMFEIEGWADKQNAHFFIDDPVSSLDDHNIFITASTLLDLIEKHHEKRKIIITTHHMGIATILGDWLLRGEKSDKYKKITKQYILEKEDGVYSLANPKKCVLLYHLRLLQLIDDAIQSKNLEVYHIALLRQALENIASFLGKGQVSYVLQQIGITDPSRVNDILNALTHQKVYYPQNGVMVEDNKNIVTEVFNAIQGKYNFELHTD